MISHTISPNFSKLEVISTGARRREAAEKKLRIVAESTCVPRNLSATARRHGITSGQLFGWRKLLKQGLLATPDALPGFVPALVGTEPSSRIAPGGSHAACPCSAGPARDCRPD